MGFVRRHVGLDISGRRRWSFSLWGRGQPWGTRKCRGKVPSFMGFGEGKLQKKQVNKLTNKDYSY